MTDIAIIPVSSGGRNLPGYDISLSGSDLLAEAGLKTAVIISLFTDRQAETGDVLPDESTNRRGHWGDAMATVDGDRIGSRLWLLDREKQTSETRNRAREYAIEALQWLIDDGVAATVDVAAAWLNTGELGLSIDIMRPDGTGESYRFEQAWNGALHAI